MENEKLISWIDSNLINSLGRLDSNKLRSPKYIESLKELAIVIPLDIPIQRKVWLLRRGLVAIPKCDCGKDVNWSVGRNEYPKFCSVKCSSNDEQIKNKKEISNLEKYGVKHILSNKDIRVRIETTNLERYGNINPLINTEINKKSKETLKANYGVDSPLKSEKIRNKVKTTNLLKYNAVSKIQSKEELTKTASIKTSKLLDSILTGTRLGDRYTHLFSEPDWVGVKGVYTWKCITCDKEFEDSIEGGRLPRCPVCEPVTFPRYSLEEKDLVDYISQFHKPLENVKNIIYPKELDIYIPELKIAIEYNGAFWHSDSQGKTKRYHVDKTDNCEKVGVKLIHIYDWEWKYKKDSIKTYLKSLLSERTRVFARKCSLVKLSSLEEKSFLNENHLQGYNPSHVAYGIRHENTLVGVMSFRKPRFSKKYEWELLRLSYHPHYQVIGGSNKLFSSFLKEYNPNSIISYCDRRFFTGEVYPKLGFSFIENSEPSYWYTKNYKDVLTRYQCQKHKLDKLLPSFDAELSESENMKNNKYDKIWDCGNKVFGWYKST